MAIVFTWDDQERKLVRLDDTVHLCSIEAEPIVFEQLQHRSLIPIMPTTVSIVALLTNMFKADVALPVAAKVGESWASGGTPFTDALWPLIRMLQDFALPVGVGVAIYGMIEHMLDNPAGKKRVAAAGFGYVGVFLIPVMFRAIQYAFKGIGQL
jgi:hypothetical protein